MREEDEGGQQREDERPALDIRPADEIIYPGVVRGSALVDRTLKTYVQLQEEKMH